MAVSAPPKRKAATAKEQPPKQAKEKDIEAIISRGSSTVAKPSKAKPTVKNFNVKILSETLEEIDQLREKRPRKPTSPKLGISLQDWISEAIDEKLKRENKQYK